MRGSSEEKAQSRDRIVAAGARMFREQGAQGASVGEIMQAAGMTHGGFYRHFLDKDALLAAAIAKSFDDFTRPLLETSGDTAVEAFRARHLSLGHRGAPGQGCPAAALGPDIARAGLGARAAFSDGVNRIAAGLAPGGAPRAEALRDLALMVGAIVLARGTTDDLAAEILAACRQRPA